MEVDGGAATKVDGEAGIGGRGLTGEVSQRSARVNQSETEQDGSQQGDKEKVVNAEIERVNMLPANSSYAIHRMKVLNKLRHLISIKVRFAFTCFLGEKL
ncbi:hypothetical protein GUJ93_ZPchr0013g36753 [Zizania palustris]|uniref:Uncharacterized protein n=1 Tax=Zizania palustris TaxID=103762 RepID=A0A8J5X4W9_ZIZPA|nr:hypothetical protein GUJ93_ZPchr0013g36753 [Zizania palustris]